MHSTHTFAQGRSHASAAPRERDQGGLLVLVGAIAFIAHIVARSMLTAGVEPAISAQGRFWMPINATGALGAMLVLLGMPAIRPRLTRGGARGGTLGLRLLAGSWMFFGVFLSLYAALVQPWVARKSPELLAGPTPGAFAVAFALGFLAWLVGAALLAREARQRWIRYGLPSSALWFMVGSFVIAPDGPASNLAVNLLSNLGPVLLVSCLGYLGYHAWNDERPALSSPD